MGVTIVPDVDFMEVPHLQEILNFLPINPIDEKDIVNYIQNIINLIAVNYKYGQYQFAYFGIHLLYMTYIYCAAWKVGQIEPERYKDAIVFARSYNGREKELKIEDAESIFVYSLMPEKDIAKIFKIVEIDNSHISMIRDIVDMRDEMAHASGKFEILTEEIYDAKVCNIISSMNIIHNCLIRPIRKWYRQILISFCRGEYEEYVAPKDFIIEQMIQTFKLSTNELLVCNEMSVNGLISEHRGYETKLKSFKRAMRDYCQDVGDIYF